MTARCLLIRWTGVDMNCCAQQRGDVIVTLPNVLVVRVMVEVCLIGMHRPRTSSTYLMLYQCIDKVDDVSTLIPAVREL